MEITKFQNFYEIGKWAGDRIGFPRVGLVNTSLELIEDTYRYLRNLVDEKRITIEVQCKNNEVCINDVLENISRRLNVQKNRIKISYNPGMYGNWVIRVYTQSRVLFRKLEMESESILNRSVSEIANFIAGFADAEMTVEKRTCLAAFSISSKKVQEAQRIKKCLERVLSSEILIRSAGEDEFKIQVSTKDLPLFDKRIGKYMKHIEKKVKLKELLEGNYLLPKDCVFLDFIKHAKNITSADLTNKFGMHPDSSRRILRLFTKQGIVVRYGQGHYKDPYCYKISNQLI